MILFFQIFLAVSAGMAVNVIGYEFYLQRQLKKQREAKEQALREALEAARKMFPMEMAERGELN